LSKFPIPKFYHQMEGIFDSNITKKVNLKRSVKKEDQQEEAFLNKHNKFMANTINKIIRDNEEREAMLRREKLAYQTGVRTVSQKHKRARS
jgi:hypothetical protein